MEISDKVDEEKNFKELKEYLKEHPIEITLRSGFEPGFITDIVLRVPKNRPERNNLLFRATLTELIRVGLYVYWVAQAYKSIVD